MQSLHICTCARNLNSSQLHIAYSTLKSAPLSIVVCTLVLLCTILPQSWPAIEANVRALYCKCSRALHNAENAAVLTCKCSRGRCSLVGAAQYLGGFTETWQLWSLLTSYWQNFLNPHFLLFLSDKIKKQNMPNFHPRNCLFLPVMACICAISISISSQRNKPILCWSSTVQVFPLSIMVWHRVQRNKTFELSIFN